MRAGKTAPYYHAVSRPQSVEREATHRAISHAELTDVPIMIVAVIVAVPPVTTQSMTTPTAGTPRTLEKMAASWASMKPRTVATSTAPLPNRSGCRDADFSTE